MPTGYTAQILDGNIKTFSEFAKTCMRAFGATIHMRDDGIDKEYTPRTPSDYHSTAIEQAKGQLKDAETLSDKEIIDERKKSLDESKKYHLTKIEKIKKDRKNLVDMLIKAKKYQPPTDEHVGIKEFMIQQLMDTIRHDGETDYHDKELLKIDSELSSIDANEIRKGKIEDANENIKRHTDELNKEIARCEESNKWVTDFLSSLNN